MLTAGRIGEYAASTLPTDRWLHVALPVVPILTRLFDLVVSDLESFGDISEGRVLSGVVDQFIHQAAVPQRLFLD